MKTLAEILKDGCLSIYSGPIPESPNDLGPDNKLLMRFDGKDAIYPVAEYRDEDWRNSVLNPCTRFRFYDNSN